MESFVICQRKVNFKLNNKTDNYENRKQNTL